MYVYTSASMSQTPPHSKDSFRVALGFYWDYIDLLTEISDHPVSPNAKLALIRCECDFAAAYS